MNVMNMAPDAIRDFSLRALQEYNEAIYGDVNSRSFSPLRRVARISRYGGRVHKAVNKNKINSKTNRLLVNLGLTLVAIVD